MRLDTIEEDVEKDGKSAGNFDLLENSVCNYYESFRDVDLFEFEDPKESRIVIGAIPNLYKKE